MGTEIYENMSARLASRSPQSVLAGGARSVIPPYARCLEPGPAGFRIRGSFRTDVWECSQRLGVRLMATWAALLAVRGT